MQDDNAASGNGPDNARLITEVAEHAYQFGVSCARHVSPRVFDDPVMHNYYLFFVFGAILWLGDNLRPAQPLTREEKLSALSQAMSFLEPGSKQKIRSLVLMVAKADDKYAHNIMREGADTIARMMREKDENAARRFSILLGDETNFPRRIDPESDKYGG